MTFSSALCSCNWHSNVATGCMIVYSPLQRSNCTLGEGTTCSVVNITTVTCFTPDLSATSPTALDYALLFDAVPPTTQARLPISVQSDPSNFRLNSSQDVTTGMAAIIHIVVCLIASILTLLLLCVYPCRVIISTQWRPVRYV